MECHSRVSADELPLDVDYDLSRQALNPSRGRSSTSSDVATLEAEKAAGAETSLVTRRSFAGFSQSTLRLSMKLVASRLGVISITWF